MGPLLFAVGLAAVAISDVALTSLDLVVVLADVAHKLLARDYSSPVHIVVFDVLMTPSFCMSLHLSLAKMA